MWLRSWPSGMCPWPWGLWPCKHQCRSEKHRPWIRECKSKRRSVHNIPCRFLASKTVLFYFMKQNKTLKKLTRNERKMDTDAYNRIAGLLRIVPTVGETQVHHHAGGICKSKEAGVCRPWSSVPQYHVILPMQVAAVSMQMSHTADEEYISCYTHQQTDISSHAVNTCDVCPTLQAVLHYQWKS